MKNHKFFLQFLFVSIVLFIGGCSEQKFAVNEPLKHQLPITPPPAVVAATLGDIFFEFDRSDLRMDAREQLQSNYHWLEQHASRRVIIEGHCDNRGTAEYNLALGERRANSAKDYLLIMGVESGRMKTISYGSERPFAAGNTEEAGAQNRRDHFVEE